jgi:hypothetical protein
LIYILIEKNDFCYDSNKDMAKSQIEFQQNYCCF